MTPKQWFEKVYLKGMPIVYNTNTFSDTMVVKILEQYQSHMKNAKGKQVSKKQ